MAVQHLERFHERDFTVLVERALGSILDIESIEIEPRILPTARPDLFARLKSGQDAIVEIKMVTPSTHVRLDYAVEQLKSYAQAYQKSVVSRAPLLILIVPGALSSDHMAWLKSRGIDSVIDGPALRAAAPELPWPDAVARNMSEGPSQGDDHRDVDHQLVGVLEAIPPGKAEWASYQRTVRDILAATLSPPLAHPLDERANETKVNRRDIILPNYAENGFWKFLREHYEAHYIVVDAKNYVGSVNKNAILQIANYLNAHGTGLFGMIVCRNAADRSAEVTRREQWVLHRKLIIILNDDDLKQMLSLLQNHEDTTSVIRQKIEDFRLGF